jgi:glutathione S-transferase
VLVLTGALARLRLARPRNSTLGRAVPPAVRARPALVVLCRVRWGQVISAGFTRKRHRKVGASLFLSLVGTSEQPDEFVTDVDDAMEENVRSIPTYEEGELALFDAGAIVFHIAEHHAGLFPDDANARARAITWMFAALNTVEPPILELVTARFAEGDKPWAEERLPLVKDRIRDRLVQLSARLGDADWLDGAFSAGDLMMVSVLLRLRPSGVLDEFPKLAAYLARGRSAARVRTGFRRPVGDQRRSSASWVTSFCSGRARVRLTAPDRARVDR